MKFIGRFSCDAALLSHPSRGAWIEIHSALIQDVINCASHPSRGAWIEIGTRNLSTTTTTSRTPHGVRGLKLQSYYGSTVKGQVAPLTGCVD